jgi:hypothetical protein
MRVLSGERGANPPAVFHTWGDYKVEFAGFNPKFQYCQGGPELAGVETTFYERFQPDWIHCGSAAGPLTWNRERRVEGKRAFLRSEDGQRWIEIKEDYSLSPDPAAPATPYTGPRLTLESRAAIDEYFDADRTTVDAILASGTFDHMKQLAELADEVRAAGLGFGLWMEPERFGALAPIRARHPEWFIPVGNQARLDLTKPPAWRWLRGEIVRLLKTYRLAWMKIDFNFRVDADDSGAELSDYTAAWHRLLDDVRAAYPEVFFEGCARVAEAIAFFKTWRRFITGAVGHLLTPPEPIDHREEWIAFQLRKPDAEESLVFVYRLGIAGVPPILRPQGLKPGRRYALRWGFGATARDGGVVTGADLERDGLRLQESGVWQERAAVCVIRTERKGSKEKG